MASTPALPSSLRLTAAPLLALLALLAAGPGRGNEAPGPLVLRVYSDYV